MPKMGCQDHQALKVKLVCLVSRVHRDLQELTDSVTPLNVLTMQAWLPDLSTSKGHSVQGLFPDLSLKLEFIPPAKSSQMPSTVFLS